jgi:hypothetical protein
MFLIRAPGFPVWYGTVSPGTDDNGFRFGALGFVRAIVLGTMFLRAISFHWQIVPGYAFFFCFCFTTFSDNCHL